MSELRLTERLRASLLQCATEFEICPRYWMNGHSNLYGSGIKVSIRDRKAGSWAILISSLCLSRSGRLECEPLPSNRTEQWLRDHRFSLEDAVIEAIKYGRANYRKLIVQNPHFVPMSENYERQELPGWITTEDLDLIGDVT